MVDVASPGYRLIELNASEKFRFFGTVSGKYGKNLWKIRFDNFPAGDDEFGFHRNYITVLKKGEEELPYTSRDQETAEMIDECGKFDPQDWEEDAADPDESQASSSKPPPKNNYADQSYNDFLALDRPLQATAKTFTCKFGKEDKEKIEWRILTPEEQITECPLDALHSSPDDMTNEEEATGGGDSVMKEDLPWDPNPKNVDYNKLLFEKFFPCSKGIAMRLDKFLRRPPKNRNMQNPWKARVERDNIVFHREDGDDPDKLVSMLARLVYINHTSNTPSLYRSRCALL
jgi:hypothetical protein